MKIKLIDKLEAKDYDSYVIPFTNTLELKELFCEEFANFS